MGEGGGRLMMVVQMTLSPTLKVFSTSCSLVTGLGSAVVLATCWQWWWWGGPGSGGGSGTGAGSGVSGCGSRSSGQ